jgi:6-phosphogluconolactonase (cycloisomerase 2 family)
MIVDSALLFLFLIHNVAAVNLYVASYSGGTWAGNITTMSLTQKPDSSYSLTQISTVNTSTNSPSWITLDRQNNVLYLIDEAVNVSTGTLVSYRTSYTGQLTEIKREQAVEGGVYGAFFANGKALAIPKYAASIMQAYQVTAQGDFYLSQTFNFTNPPFSFSQGPVSDRQAAPHPHEAILDPTQRYVLIPDLGADQVHIFSVSDCDGTLTPVAPLVTAPGYGPRHGAFSLDTINGNYIFYLVGELAGNVTAYKVSYGDGSKGMSFQELASYKTLKPGESFPPNPDGQSKTAPAEIQVTVSSALCRFADDANIPQPDGRTLVVSNRNDTTFGTDPENDSVVSYKISLADGTLTEQPLVPAYGAFPRQFTINKAGTLLAMGLQNSGNMVVLKRNWTSGLFDQEVANFQFEDGANMPVCIVWDE